MHYNVILQSNLDLPKLCKKTKQSIKCVSIHTGLCLIWLLVAQMYIVESKCGQKNHRSQTNMMYCLHKVVVNVLMCMVYGHLKGLPYLCLRFTHLHLFQPVKSPFY